METMRAFMAPTYGNAQSQSLEFIPIPEPKNDQVLIRVHATTVNRSDTEMRGATYWFARAIFGLTKPKCGITGSEFAGVIERVGAKVTKFKIGDRVFGFDGDHYQAHAEFVVKSETRPMALMPDGFSFEECAALGEGASYAMNYLNALGVGPGKFIAINGATGSIGSAAVQLATHLGAKVVATARSEHFDLVKSWGADTVIDYTQEDFTERDFQFDAVFDAVGKSRFCKVKRVLKARGIFGSSELGPRGENVWFALKGLFSRGKKTKFPIPKIDGKLMDDISKMLVEGKFKPTIDRKYSFDQIMEASVYVEQGQKVGNVVINLQ